MTLRKTSCFVKQALAIFKTEGFTLIELLVVMSIVLMLGALLFPSLQGMLARARSSNCMGNLKQISSAIFLYAADHDNAFPPANAAPETGLGWSGLWYSPNETNRGVVAYMGDQSMMSKVAVCPENRNATNYKPYCVNYNVMVARVANQIPVRLTRITRSSQIVVMGDSAVGSTWNLGLNGTNSGWAALTNRHGTNLNILWADGHVSAVLRNKLGNTNFMP